ncbi:SLC45 family MFS transporter [Lactiplantibacillus paraplantarum]|uniref:MFS transporter n=1 Tax=Lactiplantibacillus paraplantarum TaxID=60520 RepID=A0AAD0TRR1_9LACO|nr:SLC45 family MFS transporter [Lactiplantibacillus paraplantarum]AYJ40294.1 MFS transporter [Lactiplantibacillus paraplantarum]KRL45711.1 major facilitator transporter [Lactiplantibacillus paraplantarum DSM 10667]GEO62646.1 sugar transporter [Lactiplantibacillus paraplantarum]
MDKEKGKKMLPTLAFSTLMLMTFGNLGTSMAFALQSSNMGRIFQTLGSDPTKLGYFFILPPLAGMIVQPLVGYFSDRTWIPKIGRRLPYLIIGTIVAVVVMCLLPNSGSFGFKTDTALWFGAISILFMDLSSNMSMQPFKMMISDMVNDEQKDTAWSWQTIWGNIGSVAANLFPFFLTWIGVTNVAAKGELPDSVKFSFYLGTLILVVSSFFTIWKVDEYDPETYAKYHGLSEEDHISENFFTIVKNAPKVFWTLGLVEFFAWTAFQYLWTYGTGTVAKNIWHTTNAASAAYQAAGNWFGVLSAIEVVVAIIWGLVLTKLNDKLRKPAYSFGMLVGALGFWGLSVAPTRFLSVIAFIGIGISWVTINSIPFTILTNALDGKHDGTYMGLFNCWICFPQIVASIASFALFPLLGNDIPHMLTMAGVLCFIGIFAVYVVKETSVEKGDID